MTVFQDKRNFKACVEFFGNSQRREKRTQTTGLTDRARAQSRDGVEATGERTALHLGTGGRDVRVFRVGELILIIHGSCILESPLKH